MADRLERFFSWDEDSQCYRVQKQLRDMLIFSEQDVPRDPPFSRLDMISCRNLLIYMDSDLQRKIIALFHYALKPGGVLFLGSSEMVGDFASSFSALDRKWKIYRRKAGARGAAGDLAVLTGGRAAVFRHTIPRPPVVPDTVNSSYRSQTEQALLRHYVQSGVLVNELGEILHIYGRTGMYLEPAPGNVGMNILAMARDGLRLRLTTALHRAATQKELVRIPGLQVKTNGARTATDLTLIPVRSGVVKAAGADTYLVILEASPAPLSGERGEPGAGPPVPEELAVLEEELRARDEYIQVMLEAMNTTNSELASTNEEMQSINEELQSTNEELQTSKEEMQSINEELTTVNSELLEKVSSLARANNDMNNLLAGTGIGTLFLDLELNISRFTPTVTQVFNLIPSDVGRPFAHIVPRLVGYDALQADVQAVLERLEPFETEVKTSEGVWYLMRAQPYRTLENAVEGAVLTFTDITKDKRLELKWIEARGLAESIVETVRSPLVVLDDELRVITANRSFYELFSTSQVETEGHRLYTLEGKAWAIPELRERLGEILPENTTFEDYEVTLSLPDGRTRRMLLNGRRLNRGGGASALILLTMEDVTAPRPASDGGLK